MPEQVKPALNHMKQMLRNQAESKGGLSDREIRAYTKLDMITGDEDWIHPAYYASRDLNQAAVDALPPQENDGISRDNSERS